MPKVRPNILLVIADDVGVDKIGAYGENPEAPATPNIDRLAEQGLLFRRAFANPKCSPTRAGILTGRYGFRYGIGDHLIPSDDWALLLGELTIPEALDLGDEPLYQHSAVGKWHLGGFEEGDWGFIHPNRSGFALYAGAMENLVGIILEDGRTQNYFHYRKVLNGSPYIRHVYATVDTTNDAIHRIDRMEEPWFLWMAYNAAHSPYHAPPDALNPSGVTDDDSGAARYDAMVESIDMELGRLLDSIPPDVRERTLVVFIGDNGTPGSVRTGPQTGRPGKETVYEGGIRVPLVVAGPSVLVPGSEVEAMVLHTDLFATFLELAEVWVDLPSESISMAAYLEDPGHPSQRDFVFAERFRPNGFVPHEMMRRTVREERWKLIVNDGVEELYDLETDPLEATNLATGVLTPEAEEARERLHRRLADVLESRW